jgi:hypothetical protein
MILSQDSITSKLYRWFYDCEKYEMPKNLCPYFWSLVWMYLTIIPSIILSLPLLVEDKFKKGSNKPGTGIFVWFILFMGFTALVFLSRMFIEYESESIWMEFSYFGGGVCAFVVGGTIAVLMLNIQTQKNRE